MLDEIIIAVPRNIINDFLKQNPYGFVDQSLDEIYKLIVSNCVSVNRSDAETDESLKQIIPYILISHNGNYFLSRRKNTQAEVRLHNKMSLGFGGHINPIDSSYEIDIIVGGLVREIREEVSIGEFETPRLLGFINDDISEVGRVHLGLLFEIHSCSDNVEIIEKDKMDGAWASISEITSNYENLESWSKIAFDAHLKHGVSSAT
ncbi:hypothetical protein A6C57_17070 [Fibrella sp. ES10-3-2-2]|nr:hypothetical protein A6C57_17070 [Fibrella sp. ES10-3-2-2]